MTNKHFWTAFAVWMTTSASLLFGGLALAFAGYSIGVPLALTGLMFTMLPLLVP
jgi:hypothetical protein